MKYKSLNKSRWFHQVLIAFLMFHFTNQQLLAQYSSTEKLLEQAKVYEDRGDIKLAADYYCLAARNIESTTPENGPSIRTPVKYDRYRKLQQTAELYSRSVILYGGNYNFNLQDYCDQKVAFINLSIALEGLEGLDYSLIKDKFEPDAEKPSDKVLDKSKVPYKAGEYVYFYFKKANFRLTPPEALIHIGPKKQIIESANKDTTRTAYNLADVELIFKLSMRFEEYLGDYNKNFVSNQQSCDDKLKNHKRMVDEAPNKNLLPLIGVDLNPTIETMDIGFGQKACLTIERKYSAVNKDTSIHYTIQLEFNKNSYLLHGVAPSYWDEAIIKTIRSMRLIDTGNYVQCKNGQFQELKLSTIHNYYRIPNPSKGVRITITPIIERTEVPKAWHDYLSLVRKGVEQIASIQWEEDKTPDEAKRIILVLNKLGFEEITPGKVADAYLATMDKMITGIEGLQLKMTNMAVEYRCEIPYITVHTECVPRVICKNNKYIPDYTNMTYREISRTVGTEIIQRGPLTMNGVQQLEQGLVARSLGQLQSDLLLLNEKDKCARNAVALRNMDFGIMPDVCSRNIAQYNFLLFEIENAKKDSIQHRSVLLDFQKTKAKKEANLTHALDSINKRIRLNIDKILKANAQISLYEENASSGGNVDQEIAKNKAIKSKLEDQNVFLKESRLELQNTLDGVKRRIEADLMEKIEGKNEQLFNLRRSMTLVKKAIETCK